jgi:hypothetical protein
MNVLSKFKLDNIKFLDIQAGEYNLGAIPNIIIGNYLDKFNHNNLWQNVMNELLLEMRERIYYQNLWQDFVNYKLAEDPTYFDNQWNDNYPTL